MLRLDTSPCMQYQRRMASSSTEGPCVKGGQGDGMGSGGSGMERLEWI